MDLGKKSLPIRLNFRLRSLQREIELPESNFRLLRQGFEATGEKKERFNVDRRHDSIGRVGARGQLQVLDDREAGFVDHFRSLSSRGLCRRAAASAGSVLGFERLDQGGRTNRGVCAVIFGARRQSEAATALLVCYWFARVIQSAIAASLCWRTPKKAS